MHDVAVFPIHSQFFISGIQLLAPPIPPSLYRFGDSFLARHPTLGVAIMDACHRVLKKSRANRKKILAILRILHDSLPFDSFYVCCRLNCNHQSLTPLMRLTFHVYIGLYCRLRSAGYSTVILHSRICPSKQLRSRTQY